MKNKSARLHPSDYVATEILDTDKSVALFHTHENYPVDHWQKVASPVWEEYPSPVWWDINQSATLQRKSARTDKDEKHICPLQLPVIERCVELWSKEGEIVLDPFDGIGSTGYQALKMGRRHVGVELKQSYYEQAAQNLAAAENEV